MTVNEAIALAARIESLARRAYTYNKSVDDLVEELEFISQDLRDYADRLDEEMATELDRIFA